MEKNDLLVSMDGQSMIRVLAFTDSKALIIDCIGRFMPIWVDRLLLDEYACSDETDLFTRTKSQPEALEDLSPLRRKIALERYSIIAGALAVLADQKERSRMIELAATSHGISKQTIRNYLRQYLIYQTVSVLAPKAPALETRELSQDQRNIRWALNKFFYTQHRNSLNTAYTMMLKEKYTDAYGRIEPHPSFHQFRYFYRKTRKMENLLISRDGLKAYQRNNRPLIGDGVQEYAPQIGTAYLDGTICDIYLVNEQGELVGRPILVAAADANTSLCLGYALLWEGGTYSLQQLMLNIIADKTEHCRKMGIQIKPEQWPVDMLPGIMVSDKGSEYTGRTFSQIVELGVTLIDLPSFRPELKGTVEKLFDLIQDSYKNVLKGRGVVLPDYQDRGAHDYRKDAILTIEEFERIVVRCIVYYNSERVLESYPYTKEMLDAKVPPHASDIWRWKQNKPGTNLIPVAEKNLVLTLLPRTQGSFSRFGLKVNRLRYHAEGFKEHYLSGGKCIVAYNPDSCNKVWLRNEDGSFTEFDLIEGRYQDKTLAEVEALWRDQKELVRDSLEESYKAKIELMQFIEMVAAKKPPAEIHTKDVRTTRETEKKAKHNDIGGRING